MSAGEDGTAQATTVTVRIAGEDYRIACDAREAANVAALACDIDVAIADTRAKNPDLSAEGAAVVIALSHLARLRAGEASVRRLQARCATLEREREAIAFEDAREDEALVATLAGVAETIERLSVALTRDMKGALAAAQRAAPFPPETAAGPPEALAAGPPEAKEPAREREDAPPLSAVRPGARASVPAEAPRARRRPRARDVA